MDGLDLRENEGDYRNRKERMKKSHKVEEKKGGKERKIG